MSVTRIAERAGVSIATVSRVLNNSRNVNPRLAEQVRKAVEELRLPMRSPRRRPRVKTRETGTVAILSVGQGYRGWFDMPVIASVVAELTRAAREQGFDVMMTEVQDIRSGAGQLRRSDIAGGLAFINNEVPDHEIKALHQHLPLVHVMGGQIAPSPVDHVTADNSAVGHLAADYLKAQGVEQMAFVTWRPSWDLVLLRGQSFVARALRLGCHVASFIQSEPHPTLQAYGGNVVSAPELPELIDQLAVASKKGRLGVFVPRDEDTVTVHRELMARKVRVGHDVIIISCDNEAVRLSTLHPRPASIDLNAQQVAHHAVRRLAVRIGDPDSTPVRVLIPPHVVAGDAG